MSTQSLLYANGGTRSVTALSGTAGDTLLFSGTGRLNRVLCHQVLLSGQPVVFYDAAVASSGGPYGASGHVILGKIPSVVDNVASGAVSPTPLTTPVLFDVPFFSGLCVAQKAAQSGGPGWSAFYTPEKLYP